MTKKPFRNMGGGKCSPSSHKLVAHLNIFRENQCSRSNQIYPHTQARAVPHADAEKWQGAPGLKQQRGKKGLAQMSSPMEVVGISGTLKLLICIGSGQRRCCCSGVPVAIQSELYRTGQDRTGKTDFDSME